MAKRERDNEPQPPAVTPVRDPVHPGNAWDGVAGQSAAVAILGAALRNGRVAHAYLFTGSPGAGRELCALRLATALLCTGRPPGTPPDQVCGACPSCLRVVRGHHPDVHTCLAEADAVARGLLEWTESRRQPSREIKVEQVRALRDGLRMAPYEGGWRVAVIPQAERLRVEAGNALLKTLEEPLPRTLLVLCAPDRQAVLPTLVSRCQVVPFSPLSEEVLVSLVRRRRGLDDEAARAVAREAQGSATRAMAEEPGKAAAAWDQARDWLRALEGGAPHVLTGMAESMEKDREGLERRVERLARLAVHEAEAGMAAGAAERARFHARVAADAMALQAELSLPGATVRLALERFSLRPRVRAGPDRAW